MAAHLALIDVESAVKKRGQNDLFHKTAMCKFHLRHACSKGSTCNFAHSRQELQPLPDLRCTRLCPHLLRAGGACGDPGCRFAHQRQELREATAPTPARLAAVAPAPAPAPTGQGKASRRRGGRGGFACAVAPGPAGMVGCPNLAGGFKATAQPTDFHPSPAIGAAAALPGGTLVDQALSCLAWDAWWLREPTCSAQDTVACERGHSGNLSRLTTEGGQSAVPLTAAEDTADIWVKNTFLDVQPATRPSARRASSAPASPGPIEAEAGDEFLSPVLLRQVSWQPFRQLTPLLEDHTQVCARQRQSRLGSKAEVLTRSRSLGDT